MIRYNYHFRHIVNMTHSHYYEQSIIFAHFTTHTYDYVTLLRRMSIWDLDHFLFWQTTDKSLFSQRKYSIFLGPSCVKEIQSRFSSSQEGSSD